jgi:hypothetical protein
VERLVSAGQVDSGHVSYLTSVVLYEGPSAVVHPITFPWLQCHKLPAAEHFVYSLLNGGLEEAGSPLEEALAVSGALACSGVLVGSAAVAEARHGPSQD